GEDLISGRLAEPREPAARNFESYETLIAQRDKALGLRLDFGRDLFAGLQVIHHEDVRISGRRSLLEATARHLQYRVEPFDNLRESSGIELHEYLGRVGDCTGGNHDVFSDCSLEAFVDDYRLLFAVWQHINRASYRIARLIGGRVDELRGHLQLLLPDLRSFDSERCRCNFARSHLDLFDGVIAIEREPRILSQLERDSLGFWQIV